MLSFSSICPHPPLLIPSIGRDSISKVSSTIRAMEKLGKEVEKAKIETLVVISPHGPVQMDNMSIDGSEILHGDFLQFGDETSMNFKNDVSLGQNIKKISDAKEIPVEMINNELSLDHGIMVPLYFLSGPNSKIKIVPISFSFLDFDKHFEFGESLFQAIDSIDERVGLVASGDLSHRLILDAPAGYSPKGAEFDDLLIKLLEKNETGEILNMDSNLIQEAGECGLRSIIILLGALSGLKYKFEKLSYEGPFGVGYLVGEFKIM